MLDIPQSTLRGWHRRYGIMPAGEHARRHRRYTAADVAALTRMRRLVAQGTDVRSAARRAFHFVDGHEATVEEVVDAATRLDVDALVALLDARLAADGVTDTWERLCAPVLEAVGGADSAGEYDRVDVLHLLSWAITAALHRVPAAPVSDGPLVLLACVAEERHTLPLEALRAALAERGVAVRLLGACVPAVALTEALDRGDTPAAALVLWSQSAATADPDLLRVVACRSTALVLAGRGWAGVDHEGAARPATLAEAVDLLASR
jgi:DNA-binding transcriptional MerR regulator